jgi:hypothetical protein
MQEQGKERSWRKNMRLFELHSLYYPHKLDSLSLHFYLPPYSRPHILSPTPFLYLFLHMLHKFDSSFVSFSPSSSMCCRIFTLFCVIFRPQCVFADVLKSGLYSFPLFFYAFRYLMKDDPSLNLDLNIL